ncbi:MAG: rhodanese-like domain-containing protein [Spirochaetia bacterium]|nr:rhodanese-like domain-containing protein [Spirochaetia bacterium]
MYDNHNVLFVDARGANEYAEAHIKGAINIPVNTTKEELDKMAGQLKGKVLITYCHGIGCHLSDKTAYMLFDNGYKKVAIFFGGWPKWNEHNGPIDKK